MKKISVSMIILVASIAISSTALAGQPKFADDDVDVPAPANVTNPTQPKKVQKPAEKVPAAKVVTREEFDKLNSAFLVRFPNDQDVMTEARAKELKSDMGWVFGKTLLAIVALIVAGLWFQRERKRVNAEVAVATTRITAEIAEVSALTYALSKALIKKGVLTEEDLK